MQRTVKSRSGLSLRTKLTLLAVAVSSIPAAAVALLFIDRAEDALQSSMREQFHSLGEVIGQELELVVEDATVGLQAVGHSLAAPGVTTDDRIAAARAQVSGHPALRWVGIYDAGGALIDTLSAGAAGPAPELLAERLRRAALEHGRALGEARPTQQLPEVLMVVPIRGEAATWFAATAVTMETTQAAIERLVDRRLFGEHYRIFVVDRELRILAHSNRELARAMAPAQDNELLEAVRDPGTFDNDVVVFRDRFESGGREMVASASRLRSVPWMLVIELPRDVAYGALTRLRVWVIAVVVVVIFIAAGAAAMVARRITEPIRRLVGFSRDLAERRYDSRIDIDTGDELSILAGALSTAASELAASEVAIREEVAIRSDLGRYLPSQLVEQIIAREQRLELGGERRSITVMFADVVEFTPLAEKHAAEEVVTILNELFTILTEIVFRYDGTVDKFVGDCVMAFWGAPQAQPDHAARAVGAAEEMLRWLDLGNDTWRERFGVEISLAIGIHTGEAVVGNFGCETRMDYTAIGDVVNIASRLESRARPGQILLTASTRAAAGSFRYHPLGSHQLAGTGKPLELFEVRS